VRVQNIGNQLQSLSIIKPLGQIPRILNVESNSIVESLKGCVRSVIGTCNPFPRFQNNNAGYITRRQAQDGMVPNIATFANSTSDESILY
jgi:hypothetical protein